MFIKSNNNAYLNGKVFLVTGASSGIGFETAKLLLEQGAVVFAMVRNTPAIKPFSRKFPQSFDFFAGDAAKQKDCESFINRAVKRYKTLHGLIHCAGVSVRSNARDIQHDVFRNIMDVNFFAMVYLFNAARIHLEKTRGHVIAVSSVQGLISLPYRSAYASAKHALNSYIKCIRLEEPGIHFLCVNFGYVNTNFSNNAFTGKGEKSGSAQVGKFKGMQPARAARIMIHAMLRGKKEITPAGWKEKLTLFLYKFFPRVYDALILRFFKLE